MTTQSATDAEAACYCTDGPIRLSTVLDAEERHLRGDDSIVVERPWDDDEESRRLDAVRARLHARDLSAVCLSGGGIRSASIALGVLQSLARRGALRGVDYLSTVSGGGYTGAWLTRWRYEAARSKDPDVADPLDLLAGDPAGRRAESKPVEQLRLYSRYLDPQIGVLSADVWSVIVTIGTNLALNWLVLVPLVAAGVMVPLLYLHMTDFAGAMVRDGLTPPAWAFSWAGDTLIAAAMGFALIDMPSGGNARQSQRRFLFLMLAPLCVGKLLLSWSWVFSWMAGYTPSLMLVIARDAAALALPFLLVPAVRYLRGDPISHWRPGLVLAGAVAGAVGGLTLWEFRQAAFYDQTFWDPDPGDRVLRLVAAFDMPVALLSVVGEVAMLVGMGSHAMTDDDREWWARSAAWIAIVAAAWAGAGALALYGPGGVRRIVSALPMHANAARALLTLVTFVGGSAATRRANAVAAQPTKSIGDRLQQVALAVAIPVFLALMLAIITHADIAVLQRMRTLPIVTAFAKIPEVTVGLHMPLEEDFWHIRAPELWLLFFVLIAGGLMMSRLISVNIFSLHGMYRNRIVRSFLGASRPTRKPNPFTGFDADDDVQMWDLKVLRRPFHVVNITMNQVTDNQMAWQERRALPFTVTPLHAGCSNPKVGYRCVTHYSEGIRLGTAIAISGAAVGSSIGERTSPALAFLLTMFNARLGVWKGNPAKVGDESWQRKGPPVGVVAILNELLGRKSAENPYVYLSDGGHFENLGIYEMVQRRCHRIIVSDAACDRDHHFEDLANAVRKIRIDMGIPIEFPDGLQIAAGSNGHHYAVGAIKYGTIDRGAPDGILIYLKASLSGDEPIDVLNYGKSHPEFPHESTADQWFTEAQFESYRALGQHMADSLTNGLPAISYPTLGAFFDAVIAGQRVVQPGLGRVASVSGSP
jgi:hypothetical protein